jgi:hypothetical protein
MTALCTKRFLAAATALPLALAPPALTAQREEKLDGYAEWRKADVLIVDGQRVRVSAGARFKGGGEARDFQSIPLGYEVKVKGARAADGTLLAQEVEARPNGDALFEGELRSAFDEAEQRYRRRGRMFEEGEGGTTARDHGRLRESGEEVERVRAIANDLTPGYLRREDFRVYVVDNKEWNAMAAPNGSIYVFSGLLADMDDDELAIVLGHELVHATHEHSRKHFKKNMLVQLAALGVVAGAESIDSKGKRLALQVAALLGASAWTSGYGRDYEDQADRVGLRYAHEGGYQVAKGPRMWSRFARKYGDSNKLVNFFFGNHSVARARSRNLERELALNYR